LINKLFT